MFQRWCWQVRKTKCKNQAGQTGLGGCSRDLWPSSTLGWFAGRPVCTWHVKMQLGSSPPIPVHLLCTCTVKSHIPQAIINTCITVTQCKKKKKKSGQGVTQSMMSKRTQPSAEILKMMTHWVKRTLLNKTNVFIKQHGSQRLCQT